MGKQRNVHVVGWEELMGGKQLSRSYYPECDISTAKTTVDMPLHIPSMNDTCTTIEERHIMRLTTCVVAYVN